MNRRTLMLGASALGLAAFGGGALYRKPPLPPKQPPQHPRLRQIC